MQHVSCPFLLVISTRVAHCEQIPLLLACLMLQLQQLLLSQLKILWSRATPVKQDLRRLVTLDTLAGIIERSLGRRRGSRFYKSLGLSMAKTVFPVSHLSSEEGGN